jgi:8-oxo-dGTP pyrophosphatase MutT (NUDIX family)
MGEAAPADPASPIDRAWLRARLDAPWRRDDGRVWLERDDGEAPMPRRAPVPAAVLVGFVARPDGPRVLLTQRSQHLRDHAGQISLPGGRIEPADASVAAAALREAWGEIGLDPSHVELLGTLEAYETVTGFRIQPILGWIEPPIDLHVDPFEVSEVFEVPLGFILDAANHRRDFYERDGRRRHFYVLPYQNRYIWGATAAILVNLASRLRG